MLQQDADVQIPGKIYEYLYVAKPLFALAHPSATADFVKNNGLGLVANPDRLDEVVNAVRRLRADYLRGQQDLFVPDPLLYKHHSRNLAKELDILLTDCISRRYQCHWRNDLSLQLETHGDVIHPTASDPAKEG